MTYEPGQGTAPLRGVKVVEIAGIGPGAAERLGLGPKECHARNPRLVCGRMTGWARKGRGARSPGTT